MIPADPQELATLRAALAELLRLVDAEARRHAEAIARVRPGHRASALNLAHYLGLRRHDIRSLQLGLAGLGLSSLGRCEGHVRDTLQRVVAWMGSADGDEGEARRIVPPDARSAERLLHEHSRALLGPRPGRRHVYIMVTAPASAEATPAWADALLAAGADLLRINAAHEDPAAWERIAAVFRAAAERAGRPARVVVDLPGPKLRAHIRSANARVLHLPRDKDALGRTRRPTRLSLRPAGAGGDGLPVPLPWLEAMQVGDTLVLTDPRGRDLPLTVVAAGGDEAVAECVHALYAVTGSPLAWWRGSACLGTGAVGALGAAPARVELSEGDRFTLGAEAASGAPDLVALALPEPGLLAYLRPGERLILDDGRIGAVVESVDGEGAVCRVTRTLKPSVRLRDGKGVALPDTDWQTTGPPAGDEAALAFALEHADAVGVSFVNTAADVAAVGARIAAGPRPGLGMILKLETRSAMRNLGAILFEALCHAPVGIMIARGDLAVDLGFERLAEMQEELLWFGEACHLPVIWATQVLDSLAHSGIPTRAEITDAAMAMRAECVMLNRGPHIAEAVRVLADIIERMEAHQYKKRALFRPLTLAGSWVGDAPPEAPAVAPSGPAGT